MRVDFKLFCLFLGKGGGGDAPPLCSAQLPSEEGSVHGAGIGPLHSVDTLLYNSQELSCVKYFGDILDQVLVIV